MGANLPSYEKGTKVLRVHYLFPLERHVLVISNQ